MEIQKDPLKDWFVENIKIENILGLKGRVRILRYLALEGEKMISNIAQTVKINHRVVSSYLTLFERVRIVELKEFGRHKIYRFRVEIPRNKTIKEFFESWHDEKELLETLFGTKERVALLEQLVLKGELPISRVASTYKTRKKRLDLLGKAGLIVIDGEKRKVYFLNTKFRNQTIKELFEAWE